MSGHEVHDATPEPLTLAWRLKRIRIGDLAMAEARKAGLAGDRTDTMIHIMTAQAHYAAANVRATEPQRVSLYAGGVVKGPSTVVIGGEPPNPVPLRDRINQESDRPRRPGA